MIHLIHRPKDNSNIELGTGLSVPYTAARTAACYLFKEIELVVTYSKWHRSLYKIKVHSPLYKAPENLYMGYTGMCP